MATIAKTATTSKYAIITGVQLRGRLGTKYLPFGSNGAALEGIARLGLSTDFYNGSWLTVNGKAEEIRDTWACIIKVPIIDPVYGEECL